MEDGEPEKKREKGQIGGFFVLFLWWGVRGLGFWGEGSVQHTRPPQGEKVPNPIPALKHGDAAVGWV